MANRESIADAMPHPTLPKIHGVPTYESIADLHRRLNENAASVQTNLGGGRHGYLALTISAQKYNQVTGHGFVIPADPGPFPILPPDATPAQVKLIETQHREALIAFQTYNAVSNALKRQLLAAIDDTYLRGLRDNLTGYASSTPYSILTHLYLKYGRITPNRLLENEARMKEAWDPSTPIETL